MWQRRAVSSIIMVRTQRRERWSWEENGFLGSLWNSGCKAWHICLGKMKCFERNDLGVQSWNPGEGAECLSMRDSLLWGKGMASEV